MIKVIASNLKPTNKSYRIDETYINVEGEDKYLYRALDSTAQTNRLSTHGQTRYCRSQTLPPQGYRRIVQSDATGDERGQKPGISGCKWKH